MLMIHSMLLGREVKFLNTTDVPDEYVDRIGIIQSIYFCEITHQPRYTICICAQDLIGDGRFQSMLFDAGQDDFIV